MLTVPVFTYVLGYEASQAIAMSLPVVGMAAAVGAARAYWRGTLQPAAGLLVGSAAMVGSTGGAWVSRFLSGRTQLLLLAVVMLSAAAALLTKSSHGVPEPREPRSVALVATGVGVGILTGLAGVGGGFLIVPALIVVGGLSVLNAVGTSLFVITLSTAAGLAGYAGRVQFSWPTVLLFGTFASAGTLAGGALGAHVKPERLQQIFAVLVALLGGFILIRG
jgi:hypothetical protein